MSEADSTGATSEDVEQTVAEAEEKGYYGETPDYDRDAYTLTTGPESPSSLEATLEAKKAEIDAQLDEFKERAQQRSEKASARVEQAHERVEQEKPHAQQRQAERQGARQSRKES